MVHASLEMDVNQDLSAAIKAMEIARAVRPSLSRNLDYVRTCAAILRRLGDIEPIRWIFHNALGDDLCNAGKGNADNNLITSDQFVTDKKTRLTLWEDLLQIELKMGLSDIGRISIVREAVLKARSMAYPQGPPVIHATTALSPDEAVFFEYPAELFDKCNIPGVSLTLVDADMKNRCRGAALIDELVRGSDFDPNVADGGKKGRGKNSMEQGSALDADSSILAGLPAFFRELLTKLPPFNGSVPDIDAFVDNLRRTVLPPRPAEEPHGRRQQQQNEQVSTKGSILMKRGRQHNERSYDGGMDIIEDAEILGEHIDADMGFQAEEDAIAVMESRDDVFKRRHRQKIANE